MSKYLRLYQMEMKKIKHITNIIFVVGQHCFLRGYVKMTRVSSIEYQNAQRE